MAFALTVRGETGASLRDDRPPGCWRRGSFREAAYVVANHLYNVVLMDVQMPEMDDEPGDQ
jgi:CheY-like chemotaxis protein